MKSIMRKTYLSIITSILVLIVTVTTTYAWTGILSYASTERFNIGLDKVEVSDYSLQLSLDGVNFDSFVNLTDLKRVILKNMELDNFDPEKVSNAVVEDVFDKVVLTPITMQRNGNNIGKFVSIEDITQDGFSYASVIEETPLVKKSYFDFDIYIGIEYAKNDPTPEKLEAFQNVYLANINRLFSSMSKSVGLSTEYQFADYFDNRPIGVAKVKTSSAARVALTKYEAEERGKPSIDSKITSLTIYQGGTSTPTLTEGIYSFGGIMEEQNNLAFAEYNRINKKTISSSLLHEFYLNRLNSGRKEDAIAIEDEDSAGQWIISTEDEFNTKKMMKFNVKMWIEGFDSDCFEAVSQMPITLNLIFTTKKDD